MNELQLSRIDDSCSPLIPHSETARIARDNKDRHERRLSLLFALTRPTVHLSVPDIFPLHVFLQIFRGAIKRLEDSAGVCLSRRVSRFAPPCCSRVPADTTSTLALQLSASSPLLGPAPNQKASRLGTHALYFYVSADGQVFPMHSWNPWVPEKGCSSEKTCRNKLFFFR